jgi:glucarate dehydratase
LRDRDSGGRGLQTFDLRTAIHAVTAVESALLDLLGQHLNVPVAALLGEGQQRERGGAGLPVCATASTTSSSRAACCAARGSGSRHRAARALPEARVTLDPNGGWLLKDAIRLMRDHARRGGLCRRPLRCRRRLLGREVMAEFRRATGLPTATNMIATDWRAAGARAVAAVVDIPLADPHFWTMAGRCAWRRPAATGA